ncbi:histidine phosphatase family protein [Paenibacillus cymbidii]|uniref:histidine phosphatase family protein n=1 Tax=Paenibacillus cymbidii TaxID=1639034 RepID=UPI001080D33A|nr:histidine phosphatase family protein [Paenibacillus cymbidii]
MRLSIIRHADPDYANNTITAAGHLEAKALADRLQREGVDRIYTSPLPRAQLTSQYTADRLGLATVVLPWTRELEGWHIDGVQGPHTAAWNVNGETVRERAPFPGSGDWHAFGPFAGGGFRERFEALQAESDRFLASLGYERDGGRYRIAAPHRERIAVFCHLGFGLTWLAHLLELPVPSVWTSFWKAPSSVTTVLFDERSAQWAVPRCLCVGDTSHLHHAGLPLSAQGIIANRD